MNQKVKTMANVSIILSENGGGGIQIHPFTAIHICLGVCAIHPLTIVKGEKSKFFLRLTTVKGTKTKFFND